MKKVYIIIVLLIALAFQMNASGAENFSTPIYTITFDAGTGTCTVTDTTQQTPCEFIVLPVAIPSLSCANEGYQFAGWTTGAVTETNLLPFPLYSAGEAYTPMEDIVLYAVYLKTTTDNAVATLTSEDLSEWNTTLSYTNPEKTLTNASGVWAFRGYRENATAGHIQIRNDASTPSYIKLPNLTGNIISIALTFTNSGGNPASGSFFFNESIDGETIAMQSYTAATAATITVSTSATTGYIQANAVCRITSVTVDYSSTITLYNTNPVCGTICTHTITAIAGNGGTIIPGGDTIVQCGENVRFNYSPNTGYELDSLYIDGDYVSDSIAGGSYTFVNVIMNHTITVTFKMIHQCPEQVMDIPNNISYDVIKIVGRCWYKENMYSTKYQDGICIPFALPYYHAQYPNVTENEEYFGLLYTYASVFPETQAEGRTICPAGWRIPTSEEWALLNAYAIEELKNHDFWLMPNNNTNTTGFDIRGAGFYNGASQRFENLYGYTAFWSSDVPSPTTAIAAQITHSCSQLEFVNIMKNNALSIRCIME
jgi:uncharacterized protein (TIGR02145 family)